MFALIAALFFILAALFPVHWEHVDIVALGLCSLALAVLTGGVWPFSGIHIRRRN